MSIRDQLDHGLLQRAGHFATRSVAMNPADVVELSRELAGYAVAALGDNAHMTPAGFRVDRYTDPATGMPVDIVVDPERPRGVFDFRE